MSVDELVRLYRTASALVFPSLYEGFGLPPLEAMACGCPVAASDAGALPEVLGDAAATFDPTEPEAIAAAARKSWPIRAGSPIAGSRVRATSRGTSALVGTTTCMPSSAPPDPERAGHGSRLPGRYELAQPVRLLT